MASELRVGAKGSDSGASLLRLFIPRASPDSKQQIISAVQNHACEAASGQLLALWVNAGFRDQCCRRESHVLNKAPTRALKSAQGSTDWRRGGRGEVGTCFLALLLGHCCCGAWQGEPPASHPTASPCSESRTEAGGGRLQIGAAAREKWKRRVL